MMRQNMDMLILMALAEGPTYGYRLLTRIRDNAGLERLNAGIS